MALLGVFLHGFSGPPSKHGQGSAFSVGVLREEVNPWPSSRLPQFKNIEAERQDMVWTCPARRIDGLW